MHALQAAGASDLAIQWRLGTVAVLAHYIHFRVGDRKRAGRHLPGTDATVPIRISVLVLITDTRVAFT
jgi:hypothetical protein